MLLFMRSWVIVAKNDWKWFKNKYKTKTTIIKEQKWHISIMSNKMQSSYQQQNNCQTCSLHGNCNSKHDKTLLYLTANACIYGLVVKFALSYIFADTAFPSTCLLIS